MQKKIKILTYSDIPIPSYNRPYRGILFIDYFKKNEEVDFYVVSPKSENLFKNDKNNILKIYYDKVNFKKIQYSLFHRLIGILKLVYTLIVNKDNFRDLSYIRVGSTYLVFLTLFFRNKNTKLFVDICDLYSELYKDFGMPLSSIVSKIIFHFEKYSLKLPDLIFVDTPAQRDYFVEKFNIDARKCIVQPNGILIDSFPYIDHKDSEVLKEYGFKKEDKVIFYGGDIAESDGIEFLIEFAKNNKKFKYLVIGKGNSDYLKKLSSMVVDYKIEDIFIIDSFKDYNKLYKYISVSDVCVAPFKINSSNNIMEVGKIITYLLEGKKVLSTNALGVSSLYKENINYFQNNDFEDFSKKLLSIIDLVQSPEQKNLLREFAENFDFKKIIQNEYKIIDCYFDNPNQDFRKFDF